MQGIVTNNQTLDICPRPASSSLMSASEELDTNFNFAQSQSELFDVYPQPPSQLKFNSIITSEWGDVYYPSPKPTGEIKERGRIHKDGIWHRSVQVWVVQKDECNNDVRVLLQRRSKYKDTHPNLLDVSCAGHVNSGDDILQSTMRELEEELGGNGCIREYYSIEDIQQSKAFIGTSSIKGSTAKFGTFHCQEYQDVFILWWKQDVPLETRLFAPLVHEEVAGFEILSGKKMIRRLRDSDEELVPRSTEYVNALEAAFGC
ncbi:predicted protein [Thalassiosira pseudonana CCMP1335]|jgi:isopentenyldiphosphate isomerase|uniref:Nudix hydrolase domain-containing protein n=1 Tax=Thalassiosira pseudonana TaxID=35128 RepID=B8C612_THAPS|nr:predicted protein [Thalassiosira pseudonana CCMP1335]EED91603.1 predicted protein [Thalassiosira pseudonana CCMP1335]|eukprot:scaffold387_cov195-Alexandrium_tamarense.AAC.19